MKNMVEFYASLPSSHPILIARAEHARLSRIFEEDETDGAEIPALLSAATNLRSELEDLLSKPPVVAAFIGVLDSDVHMMHSIINNLRGK